MAGSCPLCGQGDGPGRRDNFGHCCHTNIGSFTVGRRALTTTFGIRSRSTAGIAGTVAVAVLGFGSLAAASATGASASRAVTACAEVASGAHGSAVATLQRALGATADGDFGPMTRAAVQRWQQAHKVKATGVVDAATWRALPREAALAACAQPV